MNETIYLKKLEQREIKPTAIRLLILKTMMQHKKHFHCWIWKTNWIR